MGYVATGYIQANYLYRLVGDSELMAITCGHFGTPGAATPTPDEIALDLSNRHLNALTFDERSVNYVFEGTDIYWRPSAATLLFGSNRVSSAGTRAAASMTQNVAMLATKVTAGASRRRQGRFFFPPAYVAEADVDQLGNISAARILDVQAMLTSWHDGLTSLIPPPASPNVFDSYPPVVLRPDAAAGAPTTVSSFRLESIVATQRRRLRR